MHTSDKIQRSAVVYRILAILVLTAGLLTWAIMTVQSADASTEKFGNLGYPWANAQCRFASGGPSCTNSKDNYDWYENEDNTPGYNTAGENYDNWGYQYRNCTSYVAWKLASLGVPSNRIVNLHNGGQWATYAPAASVSTTPKAGRAAVVDNNPGHVAFVEKYDIATDTITVSEYNHHADGTGDTWTGRPSERHFTKYVDFGVNIDPKDGGLAIPPSDFPVAVTQNSSSPSAYVRGPNGDLQTYWNGINGWNGPLSLGGNFIGSPAVTTNSTNTSVYVRGPSGDLQTYWTDNAGAWHGPLSLGGNFTGTPSAISSPTGTSVYVRGLNGDLQTYWTDSAGAWHGPLSLGGNFVGMPAAVINSSGASVYVHGVNGDLQTYWTNSSGWNGPLSLGGNFTSSPSATTNSTNTSVYVRGPNGDLQTYWTGANGWNGPLSLGGNIGQ